MAHQLGGIACHQGVLLVLGHRVVAGAKHLGLDLAVVQGLAVASGWGVFQFDLMVGHVATRFEKHGLELSLLATATTDVGELRLRLVVRFGLTDVQLFVAFSDMMGQRLKLPGSLADTLVHQTLHSLLALQAAGFEFVDGRVHNLSVHGLELAVLVEVDLNVPVLSQQLADYLEDAHN